MSSHKVGCLQSSQRIFVREQSFFARATVVSVSIGAPYPLNSAEKMWHYTQSDRHQHTRAIFRAFSVTSGLCYLSDQLVCVQVRLQLAQLHVSLRFSLAVFFQGAWDVLDRPSLFAEEEHIRGRFDQRFVSFLWFLQTDVDRFVPERGYTTCSFVTASHLPQNVLTGDAVSR